MTERDLRIDFLRGLFIVSLTGTHFTWFANVAGYTNPIRFYDIQPFGFSSPAEFFVFFSGYVLALVFGRSFGTTGFWLTQARAFHRAWDLYVLNVFTLTIIAGCSVFLFLDSPALQHVSMIDKLSKDPTGFLFRFLTFRSAFAFFEILRNYIFFIPLVAVFLKLSRVHVALPLSISFAVWLALQLDYFPRQAYVTFNPLGWQLLFFLGASIAVYKPLTSWTFPHRTLQLAVCFAFFAICFVIKQYFFPDIVAQNIPSAEKAIVGPLRLLHFVVLLWTAMILTPSSSTLGGNKLTMSFVAVGQNSLECFCTTNILVYFGAHLITLQPHSLPLYFAVLSGIFLLMLASGRLYGWLKSEPWRKRTAATARGGSASAHGGGTASGTSNPVSPVQEGPLPA